MEHADLSFPVEFNGITYQVLGNLRPHCIEFLKQCAAKFEVVLFTASQKIYADQLANIIDPCHSWFKFRLFRDACTFVQGNYIKDLTVLGRDLSKTVIVDNSPQAFGYHVENGVPIKSWYTNSEDRELLKVYEFLKTIEYVDDVRYCGIT
jgi:CTD small phosphatase-like protein 2